MVTEIIWAKDRLSLFNELERRDEHQTYPVRQMLWFITADIIKTGNVYVDQWPNFQHVCCVHTSKLYAPNSDRDVATVANSGQWENLEVEQRSQAKFFQALATERQWATRQGVILFCVTGPVVELAKRLLHPNSANGKGTVWVSTPLRHYTAVRPENLQEYERRRREALSKIDPTLIVDQLKLGEGSIVSDVWAMKIPDRAAMFDWLTTILPSSCVREPGTLRPLSWVSTYNFGAAGAGYVVPEWRGRRLIEFQNYQITVEICKICPSKRFLSIWDENIASIKSASRVYFDWERSDLLTYYFVYDNDSDRVKEQGPARAKI